MPCSLQQRMPSSNQLSHLHCNIRQLITEQTSQTEKWSRVSHDLLSLWNCTIPISDLGWWWWSPPHISPSHSISCMTKTRIQQFCLITTMHRTSNIVETSTRIQTTIIRNVGCSPWLDRVPVTLTAMFVWQRKTAMFRPSGTQTTNWLSVHTRYGSPTVDNHKRSQAVTKSVLVYMLAEWKLFLKELQKLL